MEVNNVKVKRILVGLARFASAMMNPLLMPTYGVILVLWGSFLSSLESGTRTAVMLVLFGITCILPMAFISLLHHFKIIKDKRLASREERLYPYIFSVLCYVGACFYLERVHAPFWFAMFLAGGGLACLVSAVINLKWKISAHMAGIGGILALIYIMHIQALEAFNMYWVLLFTVFLAGILGTSRIILKCHDVFEVLAGFFNGYLCVYLMMTLFG